MPAISWSFHVCVCVLCCHLSAMAAKKVREAVARFRAKGYPPETVLAAYVTQQGAGEDSTSYISVRKLQHAIAMMGAVVQNEVRGVTISLL